MVNAVDRNGTGVGYTLTEQDRVLNVGGGVVVISVDNYGIVGTYSNQTITIDGYVQALEIAIVVAPTEQGGPLTGQTIKIGASGQVQSGLTSSDSGIYLKARQSSILNDGAIFGYAGITLDNRADPANANGQSQLINNGTIQGLQWGVVRLMTTATEKLLIVNKGTIASQGWAIDGSNGVETVFNDGKMRGEIDLRGGNDLFDNHNGTLLPRGDGLPGIIYLGDGDDIVRPGMGAERHNGGSGTDTVDFRFSGGVRVSLGNTVAGVGAAAGDHYFSFENVEGSLKRADFLMGTDGAEGNNDIKGHGGNDTLQGLGGRDTLSGGNGRDLMSGGDGNDTFIYSAPGEGRDIITDFGATIGNDDRFSFSRAGFKSGLVLGELNAERLHIGRSNRAAERDDRFIFDKKTTTLWFDADGSGRKGPVLIADLQAGAFVTALDIQIIA